MDRQDFGTWGTQLSPGDFPQALALLLKRLYDETPAGTLADLAKGSPAAPTDAPDGPTTTVRLCFDPAVHDPSQFGKLGDESDFAREWNLLVEGLKTEYQQKQAERMGENPKLEPRPFDLRLEVYTTEALSVWLVQQLYSPGVRASSVYARLDEPSTDIGWGWPLTIGFLPDAGSKAFCERLTDEISAWSWIKPLIKIVTLDAKTDSCDLLLFEQAPDAAIALLRASGRVTADCVLFLEPTRQFINDLKQMPALAGEVRQTVGTSGVGFANIEADGQAFWFVELIRQLSHDRPLDVALFAACQAVETSPPILFASRMLIRFSTLSESMRSLGERLTKTSSGVRSSTRIRLAPEDTWNFQTDTDDFDLNEMGEMLTRSSKSINYSMESSTATSVSKIKRQVDELIAGAEPVPEKQTRWIQAQAYELSNRGEEKRLEKALRAGAEHKLVVRIGTESDEWQRHSVAFPAEELSTDTKTNRLMVVFTEPVSNTVQTATIDLPQRGDSTRCNFFFTIAAGVKEIEARISVLYRNRVLQTCLYKAGVLPEPEDAPDILIEIVPEVMVREGFSDLQGRRHFDASFILNHDPKGTPSITSIRDDYVAFTRLDQLSTFVDLVDGFLLGVAEDPEKYNGPLDTPGTVELLRDLAKRGGIFYESLKDHQDGGTPLYQTFFETLEDQAETGRPKFIQVISANPDTRLPLEFIYDRKTPGPNATLCPGASEALKKGSCPTDCEGRTKPVDHVCPMGFWALSKVIERHTHNPREVSRVGGEFRFQNEPIEGRNRLDLFKGVLFASSDKANVNIAGADPAVSVNGIDEVVSTVAKVTRSIPAETRSWKVKSWDEWRGHIEKDAPSTLIMLTHTKTRKGLMALEIEDGSENMLLEADNIENEYVWMGQNQPPLVMLMGCETGSSEVDFMGFVSKFRRKGAAIVVSTGAKVRARHAIPVTLEFINMLDEYSKRESAAFGEVMQTVKQRLLARGFPMVLTLMSYGDADWRIGKA